MCFQSFFKSVFHCFIYFLLVIWKLPPQYAVFTTPRLIKYPSVLQVNVKGILLYCGMKLNILCMPLWACAFTCMTQCLQHLCASWRAAAARRCVWNVSRRKPSCRRKASRRCAAGRELWAATFSWTSSHSRGHGRCASSSPPPQACRVYTHTLSVRYAAAVIIICSCLFIESFSYLPFSLHTHLLSASLQLGQVQAMRRFFSAGWPGSSSVKVWSTWMADWPCVVASWSPPPCIVCTVRCCWPDKHRNRRTVRDTAGLLRELPSSSN